MTAQPSPRETIRTAIIILLAFSALTGGVYPLLLTIASQLVAPSLANGSLLRDGDRVLGSELIGQAFTDEASFWGRPSATAPTAYNAAASGASNLGPSNPALRDAMNVRRDALRRAHPTEHGAVPVDLLTTSASGLDPHISPAAALYQLKRVSSASGVPMQALRALVERHTEERTLGLLGEPRVNVLRLNLALARLRRSI